MTAVEEDGNTADETIRVELAIEDTELADRIRRLILSEERLGIVGGGGRRADLRITDGAVDGQSTARVLVFAARADAVEALNAGAAGVVSDRADAATLGAAIQAAAWGLTVLSEEFRAQLVHRDFDGLGSVEEEALAVELTGRESQVLALLAEGASNKVIARALGVTPHTAKFHVASIMAKLGATGRTDAVAKAMRIGLIMI